MPSKLNDIKTDKDGNWVIEVPQFFTSTSSGETIKNVVISYEYKTQEQLDKEEFEAFLKENERRLKESK